MALGEGDHLRAATRGNARQRAQRQRQESTCAWDALGRAGVVAVDALCLEGDGLGQLLSGSGLVHGELLLFDLNHSIKRISLSASGCM